MRRGLLLSIALLTATLAGCLGTDSPSDPTDPASITEARTLDAPPDLRVGEWWTIEGDWHELDGSSYEWSLVVTNRSSQSVTIGLAGQAFDPALMISHFPPAGVLPLDAFGYEVHGTEFEPFSFPLEPGKTWQTGYAADELKVEVTSTDGETARLEAIGQNVRLEYTYDAETGFFTHFRIHDYGSFNVTGHGFGYEGLVQQPTGVELGFEEVRFGPLEGLQSPAPPVETVEIDRAVSHATVGLYFSAFPTEDPNGIFRAKAVAPDGTPFETTWTPSPSDPSFYIEMFEHDAAQGAWEIELETGGTGTASVEVETYDLTEIFLEADNDG